MESDLDYSFEDDVDDADATNAVLSLSLSHPKICKLVPDQGQLKRSGHNYVSVVLDPSSYSASSAYWVRLQSHGAEIPALTFGCAGQYIVPAKLCVLGEGTLHVLVFDMPSYMHIVGRHVNNQDRDMKIFVSVSSFEDATSFSPMALEYKFTSQPVVTELHPRCGPVYGGKKMTIRGYGFRHFAPGKLAVKFSVAKLDHEQRLKGLPLSNTISNSSSSSSSVVVHATYIDDHTLECLSPSVDSRCSGYYHLQVTIDGGTLWSTTHQHCCYFAFSNWHSRGTDFHAARWLSQQPIEAGEGAHASGARALHEKADKEHTLCMRKMLLRGTSPASRPGSPHSVSRPTPHLATSPRRPPSPFVSLSATFGGDTLNPPSCVLGNNTIGSRTGTYMETLATSTSHESPLFDPNAEITMALDKYHQCSDTNPTATIIYSWSCCVPLSKATVNLFSEQHPTKQNIRSKEEKGKEEEHWMALPRLSIVIKSPKSPEKKSKRMILRHQIDARNRKDEEDEESGKDEEDVNDWEKSEMQKWITTSILEHEAENCTQLLNFEWKKFKNTSCLQRIHATPLKIRVLNHTNRRKCLDGALMEESIVEIHGEWIEDEDSFDDVDDGDRRVLSKVHTKWKIWKISGISKSEVIRSTAAVREILLQQHSAKCDSLEHIVHGQWEDLVVQGGSELPMNLVGPGLDRLIEKITNTRDGVLGGIREKAIQRSKQLSMGDIDRTGATEDQNYRTTKLVETIIDDFGTLKVKIQKSKALLRAFDYEDYERTGRVTQAQFNDVIIDIWGNSSSGTRELNILWNWALDRQGRGAATVEATLAYENFVRMLSKMGSNSHIKNQRLFGADLQHLKEMNQVSPWTYNIESGLALTQRSLRPSSAVKIADVSERKIRTIPFLNSVPKRGLSLAYGVRSSANTYVLSATVPVKQKIRRRFQNKMRKIKMNRDKTKTKAAHATAAAQRIRKRHKKEPTDKRWNVSTRIKNKNIDALGRNERKPELRLPQKSRIKNKMHWEETIIDASFNSLSDSSSTSSSDSDSDSDSDAYSSDKEDEEEILALRTSEEKFQHEYRILLFQKGNEEIDSLRSNITGMFSLFHPSMQDWQHQIPRRHPITRCSKNPTGCDFVILVVGKESKTLKSTKVLKEILLRCGVLLVKIVSDSSAVSMNRLFQSAREITRTLKLSPHYNGKEHTLLIVHNSGSYETLHHCLETWNKAWNRCSKQNQGLHLLVMSYCAHHHPYHPKERESLRTTFDGRNNSDMHSDAHSNASLLIFFECLPRTVLSNKLRDGHCHEISKPLMEVLKGRIAGENGTTLVENIIEDGPSLMMSDRSEVIVSSDVNKKLSILSITGSMSPRLLTRGHKRWNNVIKRGSQMKV